MAAIVNIDQPVTGLVLDAGQKETLSLDVVNVAGRPLQVAVATVPEANAGGTVPGWITIEGETTLKLAPSETRKITIGLAPPAGAAGGAAFRLKVYEVSLPEENNSFSEVVQVTVNAAAAPVVEKKRPWARMGAIAAVLALLLAGGGWLAYDRLSPGALPNVEGRPLAEAIAALGEAGVARSAIEEERPIERDADGTVTRQTPAAGTTIEEGLVVTLTAPRPPETVTLPRLPDDATGAVAQETYGALGLTVELVEDAAAPGQEPGLVVDVTPAPGSTVAEDETVRVTVLSARATVPDVKDGVLTPAMRNEMKMSFELVEDRVEDANHDAGFVLAQSPVGEQPRGSQVLLVTTRKPRSGGGRFNRDLRIHELFQGNADIQTQMMSRPQ